MLAIVVGDCTCNGPALTHEVRKGTADVYQTIVLASDGVCAHKLASWWRAQFEAKL